MTNIVRNLGLSSSTMTAGFDNIGQLTSWNATEAGGTPRQNEQLGFGYDAAHNLHTRNNGNLAQTFTTDAANELTGVTRTGTFTMSGATPAPAASVTVNGSAAQTYGDFTFALTNISLVDGMNTFTIIATNIYGVRATNSLTLNLPASVNLNFDNNGNLTNDGLRSLAYDFENQLTNATVANQLRKDFVYDGLNRLRIRREFCWTNNAWLLTNETHFICDGYNIIQHRDANNAPTLTLTRGLDLSGSLHGAGGIGGLLAMTDGSGASYYYHQDGGGNVTALIDAAENIVGRREYDAFLRTINLTGPKSGLNQYWGSGWLLDDPDLLHAPRRTYTSNPPRWTSNDPIQEAGGINQPSFVGNNPLRYVDPLGLAANPIMGLGGAYNSDPYGPGGSFYGPGNLYPNDSGPSGPTLGQAASQIGASIADNAVNAALGLAAMTMRDLGGDLQNQQMLDLVTDNALDKLGSPFAQNGYYQPGSAEDWIGTGLFYALAWEAVRCPKPKIGWKGGEITFTPPGSATPDFRINPFGDANYPPHYHRRPGIGKHRPWDGGF